MLNIRDQRSRERPWAGESHLPQESRYIRVLNTIPSSPAREIHV
jgi:hypothetical protein